MNYLLNGYTIRLRFFYLNGDVCVSQGNFVLDICYSLSEDAGGGGATACNYYPTVPADVQIPFHLSQSLDS